MTAPSPGWRPAPAPMRAPESGETPPLVRVRGLFKSFGDLPVLRGVDMDVRAGEKIVVIGSSGSGKSTLLRLLIALEKPDEGAIRIDGKFLWTREAGGRILPADAAHVRAARKDVGMVFQHFNLFPHMTVLRNVTEAPIQVRRIPRKEAEAHALELLGRVGLADKAGAYPAQLSGGQKQRVAIARALAMRPRLMLFDEVTSALDPEKVGEVLEVLRDLAKDKDRAMILATHHMAFAREIADRVLFMDQGRILEEGPPSVLFRNPREARTRAFLDAVLEKEDRPGA